MTVRRDVCWLLVLFGVVAVPLAAQRTHEQRYFDWTALPFPPGEFAARQTTLATAPGASGGGIFLTPAASGVSAGFTFRQLDTFWYLTGLEMPGLANIRPIARFETDLASWIAA